VNQRIGAKVAQAARNIVGVAYVDFPEACETRAASRKLHVPFLPLAWVEIVKGVEYPDLIGALEQGFHNV
jgi:hypothetical protein